MKAHFDKQKAEKLRQCEQEEKQLKDIEDDMKKQSEGLKSLCDRKEEFNSGLKERKETQEKMESSNRESEDELIATKKKVTQGMEEYEKLKAKYKTSTGEEYVILVWKSRKINTLQILNFLIMKQYYPVIILCI